MSVPHAHEQAFSALGFTLMAYNCAMPATSESPYTNYNNYASAIAPAAVGCALGLLFGRGMERRSANIAALALLATGAIVAGPAIADLIQSAANRPGSERGSRKRLQGIRNAGLPDVDTEGFFMDEVPVTTR